MKIKIGQFIELNSTETKHSELPQHAKDTLSLSFQSFLMVEAIPFNCKLWSIVGLQWAIVRLFSSFV